ncbi:MAG: hypothetical protein JXA57_09130 [Armatimonadetes bacterium]|nr:hypothetical protein [Armatimonadota bacterium]
MSRAYLLSLSGLIAVLSLTHGHSVWAADAHAGRRMMAARYEAHGLVDKAVAEYLKILAEDPEDPGARARVERLIAIEMPTWLPEEAEGVFPAPHEVLLFSPRGGREAEKLQSETKTNPTSASVQFLGQGGSAKADSTVETAPVTYRALVTSGAFAAREGVRWDEIHEKGFSLIDYAYVLHPIKKRYELRVAVHMESAKQIAIAQQAMRATLACYLLAKEYLGFDPTGRWGDPIDVWVTAGGEPGGRAQGRSIYLYAVDTPRQPGEWLREVGHEYGHVCFPGVGGFEDTNDEWGDGHLAELLFPKWLTELGAPAWMPWSVDEWEASAQTERQRLMDAARSTEPTETLVKAEDEAARDYFLGAALLIEDAHGSAKLGEVLAKCPRGDLSRFIAAAKEIGVWVE